MTGSAAVAGLGFVFSDLHLLTQSLPVVLQTDRSAFDVRSTDFGFNTIVDEENLFDGNSVAFFGDELFTPEFDDGNGGGDFFLFGSHDGPIIADEWGLIQAGAGS